MSEPVRRGVVFTLGTGRADAVPGRLSPFMIKPLIKLARPHQWAKSVFVLIGPLYGLGDVDLPPGEIAMRAILAAVVFALVSSAAYVVNDLLDATQDRAHPRKSLRPIAAGLVTPRAAALLAGFLLLGAIAVNWALPEPARWWVGATALVYLANVTLYSAVLKHSVIADVMCLALGFVLRVLAGCLAVEVAPTVWLLNCTLFLAMFLAFGKRLGERRMLGPAAADSRRVLGEYTDTLLEMAVVVTGVATLLGYTVYVADRSEMVWNGFNALWLTVLPATFALFRCIVLLDRGEYDDPTELALRDRPFQAAAAAFGVLTGLLIWWFKVRGG